jgi:hypothetical protein
MSNSSPERNNAIVLEAFDTLFNKRDYVAAERFRSRIQRSDESLHRVQACLNRYFEEEEVAA